MAFVSAKAGIVATVTRPRRSFLAPFIVGAFRVRDSVFGRLLPSFVDWGDEQRDRVLRQIYEQQLKVSSLSARSNGFWIPRACTSAVLSIPICFW